MPSSISERKKEFEKNVIVVQETGDGGNFDKDCACVSSANESVTSRTKHDRFTAFKLASIPSCKSPCTCGSPPLVAMASAEVEAKDRRTSDEKDVAAPLASGVELFGITETRDAVVRKKLRSSVMIVSSGMFVYSIYASPRVWYRNGTARYGMVPYHTIRALRVCDMM